MLYKRIIALCSVLHIRVRCYCYCCCLPSSKTFSCVILVQFFLLFTKFISLLESKQALFYFVP